MGFCDLYAFNLAMMAKQEWRMLENLTSLMACMYKARYFPNGDILNASIGNNPSYAWRSIHKSIEINQQGTRWRVGNGKTIHIWDDSVCQHQQLKKSFPQGKILETSLWYQP